MVPSFVASRPPLPVWRPLPHFPAGLVRAAVFRMQGPSCLVSTPAGLARRYAPALPPPASAKSLGHAHPPSSVRTLAIGKREHTRGSANAPTNQLRVGTPCRRLVRSRSLRPSWLLASWLIGPGRAPEPSSGLYVQAFRDRVTSIPAGYDYRAQGGIAPTGLVPVRTVARLLHSLPQVERCAAPRARLERAGAVRGLQAGRSEGQPPHPACPRHDPRRQDY
jgi:hypothetical protein